MSRGTSSTSSDGLPGAPDQAGGLSDRRAGDGPGPGTGHPTPSERAAAVGLPDEITTPTATYVGDVAAERLALLAGLRRLRDPFPPEQIGKLPRVTCKACRDNKSTKACSDHPKVDCTVCGQWISPRHVHLDYVGHAAVTDRLLEVDPLWSWAPLAVDADGFPLFHRSRDGSPVGLWIVLTVLGVQRQGFGNCANDQNDAEKVLIGDALRNAGMRFGMALDLWVKGQAPDSEAVAYGNRRGPAPAQQQPPQGGGRGGGARQGGAGSRQPGAAQARPGEVNDGQRAELSHRIGKLPEEAKAALRERWTAADLPTDDAGAGRVALLTAPGAYRRAASLVTSLEGDVRRGKYTADGGAPAERPPADEPGAETEDGGGLTDPVLIAARTYTDVRNTVGMLPLHTVLEQLGALQIAVDPDWDEARQRGELVWVACEVLGVDVPNGEPDPPEPTGELGGVADGPPWPGEPGYDPDTDPHTRADSGWRPGDYGQEEPF